MDIIEAIRKMNTNGFSQVPICSVDGKLRNYLSWDGIFRGVCKSTKLVEGLSDTEKDHFFERLINGVGFAGHYNRHRYKIATEIL